MFISRINQDVIFQSIEGKFVTTVLGSRRVGKSFLIKEYMKQHSDRIWVNLNMDSLAERESVISGKLQKAIEESAELKIGIAQKIWVIIDEAQKCPELFDQVKMLYDEFKGQDVIKIILTGSGYLHLHQLSAETLAGRVELFYLREFGLRETLALAYQKNTITELTLSLVCGEFNPQILEEKIQSLAPLRKIAIEAIKTQLIYGGLPEVLEMDNDNDRKRYLGNYLQTYLEKDVRSIPTIENLDLYKKFMEIAAEQTGSVRQDQKIIDALGCHRETLNKYRGYLSATLMYREISAFIGSSLKRIAKSPKRYLLNNGLISYLTRLSDLEILEKTGLIGHRFENWFLNELLICLDRDVEFNQIYYWRTSAGIEIDFVVEKKPNIYPFEVTYSEKVAPRKLKNLQRFLQDEPKAKIGFYVYMGDYRYDEKERICFLPGWAI
ncbi:MAG: AAA family ATPase [Gammaproteobacteria bacterium]|nr:AAA family ATPase [Gammaproteobacteria bacterium]